MYFSILGPVEAVDGGGALPLGGPRQRALLALLLVNANRVVGADRLVEELWTSPPRDAHAALQNQVSRLRKVLPDRLVTKPPGYSLRVEEGELDLDRFRSLVAAAGNATEPAERSRLLREADALFRGTPFAEIDAPFAAAEAAALEELRLAGVEARVDADLDRGRHAELAPELASLVARHPLRERLRGQHILALYRCERQAEALEAYRATRAMLDEQLGLEPSPALRELERAILRHDPTLEQARVEDEPAPVAVVEQRRRRRPLVAAIALAALGAAGAGTAILLLRDSSPKSVASPPVVAPAFVPKRHTRKPVAAKPAVRPAVHRHAARSKPKAQPQPAKTVVVVQRAPAPARRAVPTTTTAAPSRPAVVPPAAKPNPKPKTTTTTAHAPANVTPTVTTASASPVPADWNMLSDDFGGSTVNWALWGPNVSGTGVSYAEQNGRLELSLDADGTVGGQYNMIQTGVFVSRCKFEDDFDVRVDYTLLQWPSASGARVQLSAWTLPDGGMDAARTTTQYGESYAGDFVGPTWNTLPTQDARGTLRVTRRNGLFTSYYLDKSGKWDLLLTGRSPAEVTIGLQLFAGQQDWAHKAVRAAFDNFSVAAPPSSFSCR